MPNTDRLINHQDGLKIVTQLEEIASALGHSNKVTGVKGSSETNYRTGNVSISPSDLGLGHIQEDIDELANEKADAATTLAGYGITDSYTKSEVDNIVSEIETNTVWKEAVTNYSDIATTYPNPEEGWTVNVTSTNETYRFDGSEWVMINANAIPEATTSISGLMTSAHVIKLNGIEEGAEVNVQADWNQTNSSHDGFIKNKPSIPSKTSELINDSNFITNENLSVAAITGEFSDLQDIPTTISGYGISDAYTKDEVDNIVSTIESGVTWKEAVTNYSDIATTYPNPEEGWTVNVTSTNSTYRYNGTEWVLINTNAIPNATTSVNGLMTTTHVEKLNSIETSAQKNVQADWNEDDYVSDSYIKNKPTLGTASAKDTPTSGDATNAQVVLGSDSRLSDARPASDVSAWAKAATKPTYTATEVGAIASTEKGTASGVAELDANGKVPSSQLPSYVDDVKEGYLNSADGKFYEESTYETEITPEADKIYVDKATDTTYRWSGSAYVAIGSSLALGETSSTAYRGDRGKAAYDHATDASKISTATASGLYKVAATAEGHISDLTAVQKSDLTALGVADASNLGTAAAKDSTSTITSGSTDLTEAGAVYNMLPQLPATWLNKTWSGLTSFGGSNVWTDGDNIYYSNGSNQYVLNKSTSTWESKTWSGLTSFSGSNVWTDGENIYYSSGSNQYVLDKTTNIWIGKEWTGYTNITGSRIWTDGDNIYYSSGSDQYILDKATSTWTAKTWNGLSNFLGTAIWTDEDNIYYSYTSKQYVLDKATSTWTEKTWNGLSNFTGNSIWTDGDNIYYSSGSDQYILDKATSTWSTKTWTDLSSFFGTDIWTDGVNTYLSDSSHQCVLNKPRGFGSAASKDFIASVISESKDLITSGAVYDAVNDIENYLPHTYSDNWSSIFWSGLPSDFSGSYVWTDEENIYYSKSSAQYIFNKSTSTWTTKTWSGLTSFNGDRIWTDGENIYYSSGSNQYVLDKSTSTWTTKTWNGLMSFNGDYIWTDRDNIYYSNGTTHYVLDKSTNTWTTKTWNGLTNFDGNNIWTDGKNIYYSNNTNQYILDKSTSTWTVKTWSGLTNLWSGYIWSDGENIYYSGYDGNYVLDKSTSTWSEKTWSGLTNFQGNFIWTDGENIYYSYYATYVLDKTATKCGSAAARNVTTSVTSGSENLVTSGGVYSYVDTVITQALNGSY